MNQNKRAINRVEADVLRLSDFRGNPNQIDQAAIRAAIARTVAARQHITDTLLNPQTPAVAAAAVFIDIHGKVSISATGIEPEMAASIADELRSLAALIEQHQQRTHEKGKRQRGDCSLFILATLAFMSATYLNQVDWIDAALSIAAQVSAALFARHTRAQSQQATTTKGAAERLFILK